MDSSVILEDCYDFTNPDDYDEDCDNFDEEEGTGRHGIFIVHSEYESMIDSRGNEKAQRYYSIYDEFSLGQIIHNDKTKALQTLKEMKYARLKCFQNLDDAYEFATCGGRFYCDFKFPIGEQTSWKMPRSQELVKFRRAIQSGNLNTVMGLVEENPRYLVGCGDTPTILQGGCRYNPLHVAAMARSAAACSYILSMVSDISFAERLYGKHPSNKRRVNVFLDLFLNMPDKGYHETPLHFASKLGALDVIKILISYRQCDKNVKNKDGLTPLEVACSRFPNQLTIKNEISFALGKQFFVPLLKSKDNVTQPIVGAPCTSEDPPSRRSDRLASPLKVKAVAGPMSEELALRFRKKWKTPPRNLHSTPNYMPHLSDPEKGFEKLGRKLAVEFQVGWKEYWGFLDSFLDLSSREGLSLLDGHLKKKYEAVGETNQQVSRLSFLSISQLFSFKTCFRSKLSMSQEESPVCDPEPSTPVNISQNSLKQNNISISEKRFNFSPMDTDKYYEVFAKRITNALISTNQSETLFEISYFQKLLDGFSKDERFSHIDLTHCHYKLSVFITKKISDKPESVQALRCTLGQILKLEVKDLEDHRGILEAEDLLKVTICILRHVDDMLCFEDGDYESTTEKSCDCDVLSIKIRNESHSSICRRISFSDGEDSSGSEESFHSARSNVDETENDVDLKPTSSSGVFLTGNSPTKVDEAVLEAIESVSLSSSDYPYISKWKMSFQKLYEKGIQYYNSQ